MIMHWTRVNYCVSISESTPKSLDQYCRNALDDSEPTPTGETPFRMGYTYEELP